MANAGFSIDNQRVLEIGCSNYAPLYLRSAMLKFSSTVVDNAELAVEGCRLGGLYGNVVRSDGLSYLKERGERGGEGGGGKLDLIFGIDSMVYYNTDELREVFSSTAGSMTKEARFVFNLNFGKIKYGTDRLEGTGMYVHKEEAVIEAAEESGLRVVEVGVGGVMVLRRS